MCHSHHVRVSLVCHSHRALHDGLYPLLLLLDCLIGSVIKITKLETEIVSSIIALLIVSYRAGHEKRQFGQKLEFEFGAEIICARALCHLLNRIDTQIVQPKWTLNGYSVIQNDI